MSNFSASDFAIDTTDSACVDTDARPLSNVAHNSQVTTTDAIEGVININKNATSKLSQWRPHSCHDGSWNVDFVLGDCVIIPPNI